MKPLLDKTPEYRPLAGMVTANGFVPGAKKGVIAVGRDLCTYSYLRQSADTDRTVRRREAELEALRIAMSPEAGCFMILWPAAASIWSWDDHAVQAELKRSGLDAQLTSPRVPETLLQAPEFSADGFRLAQCMNGFDGQLWRRGEMLSSRWWRDQPSDQEWVVYAESVDAAGGDRSPPSTLPTPLARPWRRNDWRPPNAQVVDRKTVFWISAGVAAAAMSGLAYVAGVELTYMRLKDRVATLEEEAGPIRAANRRVMSANADLQKLSAPMNGIDGLNLMSIVGQVLNAAGAQASGVEFRDNKLKISLPLKYAGGADRVLRVLEDETGIANARLSPSSASLASIEIEADLEKPK
ncbi:MAG TPA: hypothetical protein PLN33_18665 [Hyphomonadaceae bacterium]|nr:hypothetical protein [Hyphomonadaceae bacterium]